MKRKLQLNLIWRIGLALALVVSLALATALPALADASISVGAQMGRSSPERQALRPLPPARQVLAIIPQYQSVGVLPAEVVAGNPTD